MICVCNTGPLIALAKIDLLPILPSLNFEMFFIPPSVQQELGAKTSPESPALLAAMERFIHVRAPGQVRADIERATADIDLGERDVIRLGSTIQGDVALAIDDLAARKIARSLAMSLIGTAGLLLLAKTDGLIDAVTPFLVALRQQGYWLSDALVADIRQRAKE